MKQNCISLLCLIGVPIALSNYNWRQIAPRLIKQQVTWPVAQNYCRENYIDLFTIGTPSDQAKLIEEMSKNNENNVPVWTGLYNDLDSWYWSYNHLPLKNISLRRWSPGYPKNAYNEDVCGVVDSSAYWTAFSCNLKGPFICYDANNSPANKFVGYVQLSYNWLEAQTYCRTHHTDLASSVTDSDVTLLQQTLNSLNLANGWFGLTRNTWEWSDMTQPSYLSWLSGQPDNYYTWENCGMAQNGLLNDMPCTNLYYFVCSAYTTRKQIIKLQVKSDQDVFDPAVQSAILIMIKQKLEENGMIVNTTIPWRVQPDGNIFYKKKKDRN